MSFKTNQYIKFGAMLRKLMRVVAHRREMLERRIRYSKRKSPFANRSDVAHAMSEARRINAKGVHNMKKAKYARRQDQNSVG